MLATSIAVCFMLALGGVCAPAGWRPYIFGAMLPMSDFLAVPGPIPISGSLLAFICLVLTTFRPRLDMFLASLATVTGTLILLLIGYDLITIGLASSAFNGRFLAMPNTSLFRIDLAQPVTLVPAHFNQFMYLLIGCFAALCIGARFRRVKAADVISVFDRLLIGVALSSAFFTLWQFAGQHGVPYPEDLIHVGSRANAYDQAVAGVRRMSGSYSEPSALGGVVGLLLCYLLARSPLAPGARLRMVAIIGCAFCIVVSTSTTGLLLFGFSLLCGAGAFVVRAALLSSTGGLSRSAKELLAFVPLGVMGALAAIFVLALPQTRDVLYQVLFEKTRTSSFAERQASNVLAQQLFIQTNGFGVGLGGHVANSAWLTLAACLGFVGLGIVGFLVLRAIVLPFLPLAGPPAQAEPEVIEARVSMSAFALGNAASMAIAGANFGGFTFWLMIGFSIPFVQPWIADARTFRVGQVSSRRYRSAPADHPGGPHGVRPWANIGRR